MFIRSIFAVLANCILVFCAIIIAYPHLKNNTFHTILPIPQIFMVILCTFYSLSVHFSRFSSPYNLVYIIGILYSFYHLQLFPLFDQYLS
ncbi:hypothetical protein ACKXF6_05490 [Faecalibacterium taiwanense]|uniref:hypothetical protein n=1 Tax=Faecalibacterium taiwanense TaxID=3030638 RepID=UPI003AAFF400